jgi:hypothetical protein
MPQLRFRIYCYSPSSTHHVVVIARILQESKPLNLVEASGRGQERRVWNLGLNSWLETDLQGDAVFLSVRTGHFLLRNV